MRQFIDTPAKRRLFVTLTLLAMTIAMIPIISPLNTVTYILTVFMIGLIITLSLLVLRYIEDWIEGV